MVEDHRFAWNPKGIRSGFQQGAPDTGRENHVAAELHRVNLTTKCFQPGLHPIRDAFVLSFIRGWRSCLAQPRAECFNAFGVAARWKPPAS